MSKRKIVGILLALSMVAMVALRTKPDGDAVALRLGDNAHTLQAKTGFSMGYPTRANGLGPVGGSRADVAATLDLGVLTIACEEAYLEVLRTGDVVSGGRLFCPIGDGGTAPVVDLSAQVEAALDWHDSKDFTTAPRRPELYGRTVEAAYDYLQSTEMAGRVMRVPLGSWRQDRGLFIELSATRHVKMAGVPSYEISFNWSPSCLSTIRAAQLASSQHGEGDAARAAKVQAQVAEFCPPLPGGD